MISLLFLFLFSYWQVSVSSLTVKTKHTATFRQLSSGRELPINAVFELYQDEDDLIWIATQDGFVRFDGIRYELFQHQSGNQQSLHDNACFTITSLDNQLWVSTQTGIARFDKNTMNQVDTVAYLQSYAELKAGTNYVSGISLHTFTVWDAHGSILDSVSRVFPIELNNQSSFAFPTADSLFFFYENSFHKLIYQHGKGFIQKSYVLPPLLFEAELIGHLTSNQLLVKKGADLFLFRIERDREPFLSKLITDSRITPIKRLQSRGLELPNGSFWITGDNFLALVQPNHKGEYSLIPTRSNAIDLNISPVKEPYHPTLDTYNQLWIPDLRNGIHVLDNRQWVFKTITITDVVDVDEINSNTWSFTFNPDFTAAVLTTDMSAYFFQFTHSIDSLNEWDLLLPYIHSVHRIKGETQASSIVDVAYYHGNYYLNWYKKGIIEFNPVTLEAKIVQSVSNENRLYSVSEVQGHLIWSGFERVLIQNGRQFIEWEPDFWKGKSIV
ncbi:MAG: hypothetical protein GW809_05590 [Bacteroidetes bacterium]|nr:hypothetical protein [Bacteroidota bacterium]